MKCLDATFLIDVARKDRAALAFIDAQNNDELCITAIAAHELLEGFFYQGIRETELTGVLDWLEGFTVLSTTLASAIASARLSAELRRHGKQINSEDALIIGTMLTNGCDTIITRDTNFKRVKEIKVETY